jgi:tRNA pseudouridine13 synthase
MKTKQLPEDFIVEEIPSITFSKEKQDHQIFLMQKTELDTFEALRRISNHFQIPANDIGYAGLKDKHAITTQYISIPNKYHIDTTKLQSPSLQFIGYHTNKLSIGDLVGNRFTITIRDLTSKKIKEITETTQIIQNYGVPNYFDSQRFGSVIHNEFIMRYILQNNFEKAMKIFLTFYEKHERKTIKDDKRTIESHWNDLSKAKIRNTVFKNIINTYLETNDWQKAYMMVPRNLRELHKNAFQSFIWNECIKELLKKIIGPTWLYPVKYHVGTLLFHQQLTKQQEKQTPETFKTISQQETYTTLEKEIISKVLSKQGIRREDLNIKKKTDVYFASLDRPVLLKPEDFNCTQPSKDTVNSSSQIIRNKVQINFILPKGSYATMITKGIFHK